MPKYATHRIRAEGKLYRRNDELPADLVKKLDKSDYSAKKVEASSPPEQISPRFKQKAEDDLAAQEKAQEEAAKKADEEAEAKKKAEAGNQ